MIFHLAAYVEKDITLGEILVHVLADQFLLIASRVFILRGEDIIDFCEFAIDWKYYLFFCFWMPYFLIIFL